MQLLMSIRSLPSVISSEGSSIRNAIFEIRSPGRKKHLIDLVTDIVWKFEEAKVLDFE